MKADPHKDLTGALLLNAAIMPGSGHYAIGLRGRGTLIMTCILLLVIVPIARFTLAVMALLQRTATAGGPPLRTTQALAAVWHAQRSILIACLLLIAAIWIYSIVDIALRILRERPAERG